MIVKQVNCKLCGIKLSSRQLCAHLKTKHNMTVKEYYIETEMLDINEMKCNNLECNNETAFKGFQSGFRKYCSTKCQAKRIKSKSEIEHANKKKQQWFSSKEGQTFLKKLSENRQGKNNPRHKRSKEDWKKSYAKQSQTLKEKIAKGEFTPCVTNSWANSRCKIEIDGFERKYRSSWDAAFQILNPNCEYETLRVKYELEDTWHNYIVDFIDRINFYVYEIKPISESQSDINNIKRQALLKWCKENSFTYIEINDEWFNENANRIDFTKYDEKILNGMRQFL